MPFTTPQDLRYGNSQSAEELAITLASLRSAVMDKCNRVMSDYQPQIHIEIDRANEEAQMLLQSQSIIEQKISLVIEQEVSQSHFIYCLI